MVKKVSSYFYNFFFNYPTPANLTNVWNFGILSFVFLLIQIVSGIGLSMYYIPEEEYAFVFVEWIMRDTYVGWFFRYVHSNGASLFFFVVYLHLFRSLYYFSFMEPKTAVWNTGVLIMTLMIITAFTGYVLPWGQMSFWACTVITNLASVLPFFGPEIVQVIWGSYGVTTITLNRFYTAHFILPFVILLIMIIHFYFLHEVGSSNGVGLHQAEDKKKFHPYFTWKDAAVVVITMLGYLSIVLTTPNYLSHEDNYLPADALSTPMHIVPEWYFLTFYAMLRAVPNKLAGVLILLLSILILFCFPDQIQNMYPPKKWEELKVNGARPEYAAAIEILINRTHPVASKYMFWIFAADCIALAYLGMQPVEYPYITWSGVCTCIYFLYFASFMLMHKYHLFIADCKGFYIPVYSDMFRDTVYVYGLLKNKFENFLKSYFPKAFKSYEKITLKMQLFIFKRIISKAKWNAFLAARDSFFIRSDKWKEEYANRIV